MLCPSSKRCRFVLEQKSSRICVCIALLCWLLSVFGGVHAHAGGDTDHGRDHDHGNIHALHNMLDSSHEAHHAEALEVDAGVDPLLSLLNAAKSLQLLVLYSAALLLILLALYCGSRLPTFPRKPPRQYCLLRPPLRAPPAVPV